MKKKKEDEIKGDFGEKMKKMSEFEEFVQNYGMICEGFEWRVRGVRPLERVFM